MYNSVNLVALFVVLSHCRPATATLSLSESGGPSGTFHVTWPSSQELWMAALHGNSLRVEDHQAPFPSRAMDGSASSVALTVGFMDITYLRQGTKNVISIIRIIITLLLSRFCTAQSFKFFSP